MIEWIPLCDSLPFITETVEFSDGHRFCEGYFWEHPSGSVYATCDLEDFTPIWWRPIKNSALHKAYEDNTFCPKEPNQIR